MAGSSDPDIQGLRRRVLAGDREAFRPIVAAYQDQVYRCVYRLVRSREEAEDLSQEVFLKAFTRLGAYDDRWAFSTWLLTIATRTALNALRRREQLVMAPLDGASAMDLATDAAENPREQAARGEWLDRLRRSIAQLTRPMAMIFGLRHEDGLTIREIARVTGASETAVKVTLHRARGILRKKMLDEPER